jgi:YidC/Oxa1 family membrane protein insertase
VFIARSPQLGWVGLVVLSPAAPNMRLRLFETSDLIKPLPLLCAEFIDAAPVVAVVTIHFLAEVIMNNSNNSLFDSKTLIAVVIAMGLILGWQRYLSYKYPNQNQQNPQNQIETQSPTTQSAASTTGSTSVPTAPAPSLQAVPTKEEKAVKYENKNTAFEISSKGMGLKHVLLKNYTDRSHEPFKMGVSDKHSLYEIAFVGATQDMDFNIIQKAENEFEGTAQLGSVHIIRTMKINPDTDSIENHVVVQGIDASFPGLVVTIPEKSMGELAHNMLTPSSEIQEFVVIHSETQERVVSSAAKEKIEKSFPNVSLLGIGSQYFASSMVDKSEIIPEARILGGKDASELIAQMIYKPAATGKDTMELKWISYSGGKSLLTLEKIDKEFNKVIDLGFFATIGRWLLYTMQWFHSHIPNWGVAIILLTLMVRLLVLPLNVTTFRSTKKCKNCNL